MNLWWSWSREARGAVPLDRRSALAPHPPQPARAALPGRSRPDRGLRQRQRLPPALRRRHGAAGARHDQHGHLVRPALSRPRRPAGGVLLRRVRAPQLGADLLRRPGRAGGRPLQGRERPRRADGRGRPVLHEGLLRPAAPARRMAGGQRRGVRRQPHAAGAGHRREAGAVPHHGRDLGTPGARPRVADDGGPGADLSPRHQPRGRTIPTTAR